MTDGIKGRTQVKEDEDGQQARISCHEDVIGDLCEGSFCAMEGVETGKILNCNSKHKKGVIIGAMS